MMLGILGGRVYDPKNGIDGEMRDIWIEDGTVVPAPGPEKRAAAETVDVAGQVVMPGGVDIHTHVAGSKVNTGRKLRPDDHLGHERAATSLTRSGSGYTTPSTFLTAYRYAELGYTTIMEAASAPLDARHAHEEFEDMPILDKGLFITMGNNHFIMDAIRRGEYAMARDYAAWLLAATKGYAIKAVNPGGVDNWKWRKNVSEWDEKTVEYEVTPRQILTTLARIAEDLGLPHPPHVHGLNLGRGSSARTSMESFKLLEGRKAHFCHLQFLSYKTHKSGLHRSDAPAVAEAVNRTPEITLDVGQLVFGPATTMTSDGPLEYNLHKSIGGKWCNKDVENETGGGIVPVVYARTNPIHTLMWCAGLELFLLTADPWRLSLTTDHPNGGPFTAYPQVIRLLMDRDYRAETLSGLHRLARTTSLAALDREYSLSEIAVITRAGPARTLGLDRKGHLGPGADGDVAVFRDDPDREAMFSRPSFVFKGGILVVRDGVIVAVPPGRTLYVAPEYDPAILKPVREHFARAYTLAFENFPIENDPLRHSLCVPCRTPERLS